MSEAPDSIQVSAERLEEHVRILEGERHPQASPEALKAAAMYIQAEFGALGLDPSREPFDFRGETYENIVARKAGRNPRAPAVLIGAHYDSVRGSPGADDNASGVAGLLECARALAHRELEATVEFVAFNLEEQQGTTYRVGSRSYAKAARQANVRYSAALIFEMIGYRDTRKGSQKVPLLARFKRYPPGGSFIAAVGDGKSKRLLRLFDRAAAFAAPELSVVTFRSPFRGWLVWQTRLSDNASFWSEGYPSLMITDTAFLRNPNYHKSTDTAGTLDYEFMSQVVAATVETTLRLAGGREGPR